MLWLIWEMWIVLALFFAGGVIAGWVVRGRSDVSDAPAAKQLGFATRMDAPSQPEPKPEPAPEPMPSPEPAQGGMGAQPDPGREATTVPAGSGDDLTAIKGLGPKAAERLQEMGVTRYEQIAAWEEADVARFDRELNARGRVVRDDWVGQARALAG